MRRYVAVGLQLATVMSVVIAAISGFYCRDIFAGDADTREYLRWGL